MIHVLIVDDERNIREAYRSYVLSKPDTYRIVDSVAGAGDAEMICAGKQVDMILMDINTAHGESGLAAAERIKKKYPWIRIVITTSYTDPNSLSMAKKAGVDSFWFKDLSPISLIEVMDRTAAGENYWPEENPDVQIGEAMLSDLTEAEKRVLLQLAKSVSIREIAKALYIEETTVKYHLRHLCEKTQCKNKTELLIEMMQSRMVLPER